MSFVILINNELRSVCLGFGSKNFLNTIDGLFAEPFHEIWKKFFQTVLNHDCQFFLFLIFSCFFELFMSLFLKFKSFEFSFLLFLNRVIHLTKIRLDLALDQFIFHFFESIFDANALYFFYIGFSNLCYIFL